MVEQLGCGHCILLVILFLAPSVSTICSCFVQTGRVCVAEGVTFALLFTYEVETRTGKTCLDINTLIPTTEAYCSHFSDFRDLKNLRPHVVFLHVFATFMVVKPP